MATAFAYSGTGLESAIQSGSGGIGTVSSITLEVDAVPSDLSQGDNVKVALGPASDWAGGNGETAYGNIGGAGANGGTNITLTARGQEGTSAASWSEGDPVRVGVQGREDVGPERDVLQSQLASHQRLDVYADFQADDQNADGYTTASGHTLTVQTGSASIENNALKIDAGSIVTLPVSASNFLWSITPLIKNTFSQEQRFIAEYIDSSNYIWWATVERRQLKGVEKISGSNDQFLSTQFETIYVGVSPIKIKVSPQSLGFIGSPKNFAQSSSFDSTFTLDSSQPIGFEAVTEPFYIDRFSTEGLTGNLTF